MAEHSLITGLEYVPGYIDQETHDRLLYAVDQHPWLISLGHRVQVYGYRYNHEHREAYRIGELPEWASDLASRLRQDGFVSRMPNQLVANEYQPGSGIFDHMDQPVFGDVMSVSLGSMCVMRFTHSESDVSRELLSNQEAFSCCPGKPAGAGVIRESIDLVPITVREKVALDRLLPCSDEDEFLRGLTDAGIRLSTAEAKKYRRWYHHFPVFVDTIS